MPRPHGFADLALGLETADAGPVARARIDDDKGPLQIVDDGPCRRVYLDDAVVYGSGQRAAVQDQLAFELQHVGDRLRHVLQILIAAPAHHVPEEHRSLPGVEQIVGQFFASKNRIDVLYLCHLVLLSTQQQYHWVAA